MNSYEERLGVTEWAVTMKGGVQERQRYNCDCQGVPQSRGNNASLKLHELIVLKRNVHMKKKITHIFTRLYFYNHTSKLQKRAIRMINEDPYHETTNK